MKYKWVRDRIQLSLALALLLGLIFGKFTERSFSFETSDWAAKGQPILDRFKDRFIHFMPGAKIGAIIGLLLGLALPMKLINSDVHLPVALRRKLSLKHRLITYAILIGIMFTIGNYVSNGTVFLTISIPIIIGGYWIAKRI
jgi:hypothetical protein